MQTVDSVHIIERLLELVKAGPGQNPECLKEVTAILYRIGSGSDATGYLSEKLTATKGSFETWFSDTEWEKHGSDPQYFRTILLQDIDKLRRALARGAAGQD